jgi:hypothetical protein
MLGPAAKGPVWLGQGALPWTPESARSGRPRFELGGAPFPPLIAFVRTASIPVIAEPVAASRKLPSIDSESPMSQTVFDGDGPHHLSYDRLRVSGPRRFHSDASTGGCQSPYRRPGAADLTAKGIRQKGAVGGANLRRNRVRPPARRPRRPISGALFVTSPRVGLASCATSATTRHATGL